MISPVEQIKSRLNIVDVVQGYIKLQKAGANYKALCPFHSEKTPSFFVSPSKDIWHCFGCNRGGDIFSFVMEIEGVEFYDALKILADRAGVELRPVSKQYISERARLINLLEDSQRFYQENLKKHPDVLKYLFERGLKKDTIENFGIGFAPDGWRNLVNFLKSKGYTLSEMEKAGMIVKDYDRFRRRIMFPLYNASGQIVGFSGRIFGKEDETTGGKYINTPQTILYDKSRVLYGFDKGKTEIRRKDFCILVEGQMDVIMSHQAGFKNTVAVSGTALTHNHLNLIKRLTNNLVIAFDSDEAGLSAAERGIDLALSNGMEVRVLVPSSGKDAADILKENPQEWKKLLASAKHIIQFFLDALSDRKEIEKKVLPYIAILPSEIDKAHWVKEIANRLSIKEEPVWEELKKVKIEAKENKRSFSEEARPRKTRLELIKERLIGFLLWQKETEDTELKDVMENIIKKFNFDLNHQEKSRLVFEAELFYNNSDLLKELQSLALEYEKELLRKKREEILQKIHQLENQKNETKIKELLNQFNEISKKLNDLEK